ncbi:MAG: HAD family hydrolase [Saccharofermentans sp.]|nr:HAD family hydrolase [Saccharofermentans sp.]
MNLNYSTYIFDYYGTLLDSYNDEKSTEYWDKWLKVLDDKGIKHLGSKVFMEEFFAMDKEYRKNITSNRGFMYPEVDIIDVYRDIFEKYGNGVLDDEILYEIAYAFRECTREYIKLYPGVDEYLKALRDNGKKLYILSNAQRSYTWPEMTMFDMESKVDGIIMSSDYGCMKPETYLYNALFEKFGLSKEGAVMIGDSIGSDVKGAKDFGISYIHLTGENSSDKFYLNEIKG